MGLKDIYQRFLDLPNPISLSGNACLHYITTLTTLSQPGAIVKHLESQNKKVVKTRSAKIISAVEGVNSLALEVETVLEFISGGGAYLPGLENFIVDKTATIPTVRRYAFSIMYVLTDLAILFRHTLCILMLSTRFRKSESLGIKHPFSNRRK